MSVYLDALSRILGRRRLNLKENKIQYFITVSAGVELSFRRGTAILHEKRALLPNIWKRAVILLEFLDNSQL